MCDQNLKGEEKVRNQAELENETAVEVREARGMARKKFACYVKTISHGVKGGLG